MPVMGATCAEDAIFCLAAPFPDSRVRETRLATGQFASATMARRHDRRGPGAGGVR